MTAPPSNSDAPFLVLPAGFGLHLLRDLLITVAFCTVLALVAALLPAFELTESLVFSLSIGLSIHLLTVAICLVRQRSHPVPLDSVVAIMTGVPTGIALGSLIARANLLDMFHQNAGQFSFLVFFSLLAGVGISYFFHSQSRLTNAREARHAAELRAAAQAQALAEAHLRTLQAQIEPHFLFNTLGNVLSLIHNRPAEAETMMEDFIAYLRGALQSSRAERVSLGEEVARMRAFLDIHRVRMGVRLAYAIDLPPALASMELPPFLIQPLVENALRHGLEPAISGGKLTLRVFHRAPDLVIEVTDTGLGLKPGHQEGTGLSNIRSRLRALYGQAASLSLGPAMPQGVVARLRLPWPGTGNEGEGEGSDGEAKVVERGRP